MIEVPLWMTMCLWACTHLMNTGCGYRFARAASSRELKPFPYSMSRHPRLTNEAAHGWLREQVRAVARRVPGRSKSVATAIAMGREQLHG